MTIEFNCDGCQYHFKVPDSMAGKKGKCPKCGAITAIPFSSTAAAPMMAAPPPPPMHASHQQPFPDEVRGDPDDRPRRRKKGGSKAGLIIGLSIGGVLLLAGVGVGLYFMLGGSGLGDELKFLPNSTQMVASMQVAEFFESSLWKDLKKDIPDADKIDTEMKENTGFTTKDVEKVVFGGSEEEMIVIVKMKKAVKQSDVQNALKKSPLGKMEMKETTVGKYKLFKEEGGDETPAYSLVTDKMIVASNKAKVLEGILKRDKKAEFSTSFQAIFNKADFSKTVAVAIDIKAMNGAKKGPRGGQPNGGGGLSMLEEMIPGGIPGGNPLAQLGMLGGAGGGEVNGLAISAKISSDISISGTLICKDADTAKSMKSMADGFISMGKANAPPDAKELIDSLKLSQSGDSITASLTIRKSLIDKSKKR